MDTGDLVNKPPNILVYTGGKQDKVYKNIAANLLRCIHVDKYVVYPLENSQVNATPWQENVSLLVVFCENMEKAISKSFIDYIEKDGRILVFCSHFDYPEAGINCERKSEIGDVIKINHKGSEILVHGGSFHYHLKDCINLVKDTEGKPIVYKATIGKGVLVASEIHLLLDSNILVETSSRSLDENHLAVSRSVLEELGLNVCSVIIPKPTAGYIITENEYASDNFILGLTSEDISLGKLDDPAEEIIVPLLAESFAEGTLKFDKARYFSKLQTNSFGKVVLFFPIITSTMIPAEHFTKHDGIVVIAGRQVSGRGRSDNVWISPEGCAMFTLNLSLSLSSRLGQRLSCMQHIASLAIVHGIRKIPSYQDLDLRLKWPNDIYLGKISKIGGVLVRTTIQGDKASIHVGIGVNTSNASPTTCINSAIQSHNETTKDKLPLLNIDEVIALALTEMEAIVTDFMKYGAEDFLSLYYKYWIHDKQRVMVERLGEEVTISGLDDFGFLLVETDLGRKVMLQPNGNRFDIMKNLIVAK